MELDDPTVEFHPQKDVRPRMPEPLPIKLVAVEDISLPAPAGVEVQLDQFYVQLLGFERMEPLTELIYRAENFSLHFDVQDRPVEHDSMRAQGIEVLALADAEKKLIEAEIEYTRHRGITPGMESLLLLDPAGNWIELVESRGVR
jgi:hypothetical protein